MRVRDGPAAVRGDAPPPNCHWPAGREGGEEREPRVRRPAALSSTRTPRGRRIRASSLTRPRGRRSRRRARARRRQPSPRTSRSGSRARPRRSSARRSRHVQAGNALEALEAASLAGEFYYGAHDQRRSARTSARSAATRPAARRLGLQGQRRLAAGRRRPGHARGRRRRALVLGRVRLDGRARRRSSSSGCPAAATRSRRTTTPGASRAAAGATLRVDGRRVRTDARGRGCVGRHAGLVRATLAGAVRSNAVPLMRSPARRAPRSPRPRARGLRRRRDGAATARRRSGSRATAGAELLVDARSPPARRVLRALRSRGRRRDALRRPLRPVDRRRRGRASTAQRDWFWFVNGIEGDRSAAEYRAAAGDVAWWDYRAWARAERAPVVVGAFPEPFLHGWNGEARPAAVRTRRASRREARRDRRARSARHSVEPEETPCAGRRERLPARRRRAALRRRRATARLRRPAARSSSRSPATSTRCWPATVGRKGTRCP